MIRDNLSMVLMAFIPLIAFAIGIGLVVGIIVSFVFLPLWLAVIIMVVGMFLGSIIIVLFVEYDEVCKFVTEKVDVFFEKRDFRK